MIVSVFVFIFFIFVNWISYAFFRIVLPSFYKVSKNFEFNFSKAFYESMIFVFFLLQRCVWFFLIFIILFGLTLKCLLVKNDTDWEHRRQTFLFINSENVFSFTYDRLPDSLTISTFRRRIWHRFQLLIVRKSFSFSKSVE